MKYQLIETKDLNREQKLLAIKSGFTINLNKSWLYSKSVSGKTETIVPEQASHAWLVMHRKSQVVPTHMKLTADQKVYYNVYANKQVKDKHHTVLKSVATMGVETVKQSCIQGNRNIMIKNLKPEHKVFLLGLGLIIVGLTGFILNL